MSLLEIRKKNSEVVRAEKIIQRSLDLEAYIKGYVSGMLTARYRVFLGLAPSLKAFSAVLKLVRYEHLSH